MSFLSAALKSILGKQSPSSINDGSDFFFRYTSFINAFQLLNANIFDMSAPTNSDADIEELAEIYAMWGSPVATHLQDKERFKPTSLSYWSNENYGSIINFIEYKYTEIEEGEKEWCSLMMASPQVVDDALTIVPHAIFSGFYQSMPNGELAIFPREVVCLGQDQNGLLLNSMTHIGEVVCAFAYFDRTFVQMLSGSKVDTAANMEVFNPENLAQTNAEVNAMFRRSFSDLDSRVSDYLKTHSEASAFEIQAP